MRGKSIWYDRSRNHWRIEFQFRRKRYTAFAKNPDGTFALNEFEAARAAARLKDQIQFGPHQQAGGVPRAVARMAGVSVSVVGTEPDPQSVVSGAVSRASTYTLGQVVLVYGAASEGHKSWPTIRGYLTAIIEFYGDDFPINQVDEVKIAEFRQWLAKTPVLTYRGGPGAIEESRRAPETLYGERTGARSSRSPSTIRKYLKALRSVLLTAHRKQDESDPLGRPLLRVMPTFRGLQDPVGTPRPFPVSRLQDVLAVLPPHTRAVVLGAVFTGWRRGQVCAAQVSWLDDERRALRHDANNKGGREGWTPLSDEGYAFFVALREQARAVGSSHFINYFDKTLRSWRPVGTVAGSWLRGLDRVGLGGQYRFHDLKSMVLSAMAKERIDPRTLQSIAQHADIETTMKHYIESDIEMSREGQDIVVRRLNATGLDLSAEIAKAAPTGVDIPKSHAKSHAAPEAKSGTNAKTSPKVLKDLAHPARLERATFSFGG
ncbi:MAG: tyrosine-type recombinase/integrase [Rhodospirillales bacterium]|nr:tyrosine-type recombinase/integrase [Rhodospirillales bacterium]